MIASFTAWATREESSDLELILFLPKGTILYPTVLGGHFTMQPFYMHHGHRIFYSPIWYFGENISCSSNWLQKVWLDALRRWGSCILVWTIIWLAALSLVITKMYFFSPKWQKTNAPLRIASEFGITRQPVQQNLLNYIPKYGKFLPEIKVSANVFLCLAHKGSSSWWLITNIIEMLFQS